MGAWCVCMNVKRTARMDWNIDTWVLQSSESTLSSSYACHV